MEKIRIKGNTFFIDNIYKITDIESSDSAHSFYINNTEISEYDGWNWHDLQDYNDKKGYKKLKDENAFMVKKEIPNNNIFFNTTTTIDEIDATAYWNYLKKQPVYNEFDKLEEGSGKRKLNRIRNKVFKLCKELNKGMEEKYGYKFESVRKRRRKIKRKN